MVHIVAERRTVVHIEAHKSQINVQLLAGSDRSQVFLVPEAADRAGAEDR
jgi:hypothetical protein